MNSPSFNEAKFKQHVTLINKDGGKESEGGK